MVCWRADPYFAALVERMAALPGRSAIGNAASDLGLHTPGVLRKVGQELRVRPMGGLPVRVEPGAALDGQGNELFLDDPVDLTLLAAPNAETVYFVAVSFCEPFGQSTGLI